MLSGIFFFANLASAAINDLRNWCPNEDIFTWYEVPESQWTWDHDWAQQIAAGSDNVYPVGFRPYTLWEFNQPPVCIHVPGSADKKVEVLIEAESPNANICIHDAADSGVETNDVGLVSTCGKGQLYACFTAAVAEDPDGNSEGTNFSFFISCDESCEAGNVDLMVRVRVSEKSWTAGKTGVNDDLEMWCEMEKGTTAYDNSGNEEGLYFTYPSELIDDNPSNWPFHIKHIDGRSSGTQTKPNHYLTVGILSVFAVLCLCGLA